MHPIYSVRNCLFTDAVSDYFHESTVRKIQMLNKVDFERALWGKIPFTDDAGQVSRLARGGLES